MSDKVKHIGTTQIYSHPKVYGTFKVTRHDDQKAVDLKWKFLVEMHGTSLAYFDATSFEDAAQQFVDSLKQSLMNVEDYFK